MSLAEIEAQLEKMNSEELRTLALKSWRAFLQRERQHPESNLCDENDPKLLAALDQAIDEADATAGQGHSAASVRARLKQWTTR